MITDDLADDLDEAFLYIYMCIRYRDKTLFDRLMLKTKQFERCRNRDIIRLLMGVNAYNRLAGDQIGESALKLLTTGTSKSGDTTRMNQIAFEIALAKDY